MTEHDTMTTTRRSELAPFIVDLLDFMEEKIQEAVADEASRAVAIGEAAGAAPLLRDRLREDDFMKANFMLLFEHQVYDTKASWWKYLATVDRAEFEKETAGLVGPEGILTLLRTVVAEGPGIS
jgi:hypothetical protein